MYIYIYITYQSICETNFDWKRKPHSETPTANHNFSPTFWKQGHEIYLQEKWEEQGENFQEKISEKLTLSPPCRFDFRAFREERKFITL